MNKDIYLVVPRTRMQVYFAMAAINIRVPKRELAPLVLFFCEEQRMEEFSDIFEIFKESYFVQLTSSFEEVLKFSKSINYLVTVRRFPIDQYFKLLCYRSAPRLIYIEEGTSSYSSMIREMHSLCKRQLFHLLPTAVTAKFLSRILIKTKIAESFFMFYLNGEANKIVTGEVKKLLSHVRDKKCPVHGEYLENNESDTLLGLVKNRNEYYIIKTNFKGQRIIIKNHPRWYSEENSELKSKFFATHYTAEEIAFFLNVKCVIGFGSSALLYCAVLLGNKSINLDKELPSDKNLERLFKRWCTDNAWR